MILPSSHIIGTELHGTDESVGAIHDLLFDTDQWVVRHVVVDTGKWLPGRQVLLPPATLESSDWLSAVANVRLSRQQVKESRPVDSDRPVSRQMEMELYQHYSVPYYWGPAGATLSGSGYTPIPLAASATTQTDQPDPKQEEAQHLRSCNEVTGYYIKATDDDVGHVEELLLDDQTWAIRYFVVDTRNWLPGRKVLVARDWIQGISWSEATVSVNLTKEEIKGSPEYKTALSIDRGYEERLHGHYGRSGYWLP